VVRLSTGAELRVSGPAQADAVLCVNGGQRAEVAGTWSATLEWLVGRLAPRFAALRFAELRYRIKSWKRLDSCFADTRAALQELGSERTLLVGFSMGGAVSSMVADDPSVWGVVGIAPWLPHQLPLAALAGKRLRVVHGSLDAPPWAVEHVRDGEVLGVTGVDAVKVVMPYRRSL